MSRPAELELAGRDAVLRRLIERHGPCGLPRARRRKDPFQVLVRSVVSQMISTRAADTIHRRLVALVGSPPRADAVAEVSLARLRRVGLSKTKAQAIRELAQRVARGRLDLAALCKADDERISRELLTIRGIGPWTVNMFLMFHLARKDVFPARDVGVLEGLKRAYRKPERPTPREAASLAEAWAPYRSLAAWYLWRVLEE